MGRSGLRERAKKKRKKNLRLKKFTMVLCWLAESQEQDEKRTPIILWTERPTGAVMGIILWTERPTGAVMGIILWTERPTGAVMGAGAL